MTRKKILVPVGPEINNLMNVHYAMALAERLQARVFILERGGDADGSDAYPTWLEEALADLIASARLAGLSLSHMTVTGPLDLGTVNVMEDERIDLLVLGENQSRLERQLLKLAPRLTDKIIRVKEKDTVNLSGKKGKPRWRS